MALIVTSAGAAPVTRNSIRTPPEAAVKPFDGVTEACGTPKVAAPAGVAIATSPASRPKKRSVAASLSELTVLDHAVDQLVLLGLLRAHEVVALGVLRDLLD